MFDHDKLAIREVIENWALWRDAGDWERFATVWHDDGWMTATWFQGPASEFIRVSREGFEKGVSILHFLGGFTCDIAGTRAVSQTKMTINQRAAVDGVLVDVVCTGRFYDFLEKRGPVRLKADATSEPVPVRLKADTTSEPVPVRLKADTTSEPVPVPLKVDTTAEQGRWGIVRRQPIYEKDRMDPVDPAASLTLDPERLGRFPEGYRHLAYLQSKIGFNVKGNLPGLRGEAVQKLYDEGRAWLAGSAQPGVPL